MLPFEAFSVAYFPIKLAFVVSVCDVVARQNRVRKLITTIYSTVVMGLFSFVFTRS